MEKNKLSYYERNKEKVKAYHKRRYQDAKNHCKCGNMKTSRSKSCSECQKKNKHRGLNYLAKK